AAQSSSSRTPPSGARARPGRHQEAKGTCGSCSCQGLGRNADNGDAGPDRTRHARAGADDGIVTDNERMLLRAVDDRRARSYVRAAADRDPARDVNTRGERRVLAEVDVVADRAVEVYLHVIADPDIRRQDAAGADDNAR